MGRLTRTQPRSELSVVRARQAPYFRLGAGDRLDYVRARTVAMKQPFLDLLGISEFQPANYNSAKPFHTYGMVTSITGGSLAAECYIQNTEDHSNTLVRLNLEDADGYSLFNGQFVAIRGRNVQGNELLVEKIYCLPVINANSARRTPLSAVVARGPFTPAGLGTLVGSGPPIVILLGPFTAPEPGLDPEQFQDYDAFVSHLGALLEGTTHTRAVLVPSLEDYNFLKVCPQPAHLPSSERILVVPNPSLFYANEHLVSVVNLDTVGGLKNSELYRAPQRREGDILGDSVAQRLSYHLVFQRSLMPLFPADFPTAYGPWLDTEMAPDLLICTSSLGWFQHTAGPATVLGIEGSPKTYYSITSSGSAPRYTVMSGEL